MEVQQQVAAAVDQAAVAALASRPAAHTPVVVAVAVAVADRMARRKRRSAVPDERRAAAAAVQLQWLVGAACQTGDGYATASFLEASVMEPLLLAGEQQPALVPAKVVAEAVAGGNYLVFFSWPWPLLLSYRVSPSSHGCPHFLVTHYEQRHRQIAAAMTALPLPLGSQKERHQLAAALVAAKENSLVHLVLDIRQLASAAAAAVGVAVVVREATYRKDKKRERQQ